MYLGIIFTDFDLAILAINSPLLYPINIAKAPEASKLWLTIVVTQYLTSVVMITKNKYFVVCLNGFDKNIYEGCRQLTTKAIKYSLA